MISVNTALLSSAALLHLASHLLLTIEYPLTAARTKGKGDSETRVSFQETISAQTIENETITTTATTMGINLPTMLRISSALRSRHSLIRPGEFCFLSNHDLGWRRIRFRA